MSDTRYMDVRVEKNCEIKEMLIADTARHMGIPGGSHSPAVRVIIRTKDGKSYDGMIYFHSLIEQLKNVESSALTKLLKKCEVDTKS